MDILNKAYFGVGEIKILRDILARGSLVKPGTHLGFNAIRVLKKNVLTFCLHKVLIKCRVSISKSSI